VYVSIFIVWFLWARRIALGGFDGSILMGDFDTRKGLYLCGFGALGRGRHIEFMTPARGMNDATGGGGQR